MTSTPEVGSDEVGAKTTLIICSRGRSAMLADVVDNVLRGSDVPDEFIVLEEGGDDDAGLATLRTSRCEFRYVSSPIETLAGKRNAAIAMASHKIIVLSDDDVRIPPHWFGLIVSRLLRAGEGTVLTGRVLAGEPEQKGAFAPSLHTQREPAIHRRRTTYEDPLAIFNCAFHRSLHTAVGGFDTRLGPGTSFPSCEDNDFAYRVLEAGSTIVFDPEIVIQHRAWRSPELFLRLRYGYGRGQGAFYAKHFSIHDGYMHRKMLVALLRHGRRMFTSKGRRCIGEAAWFAGFATGMTRWIREYGSGLCRGASPRSPRGHER